MVRETLSTDIDAMPELARLAHEVARTGKPCVLRENGVELAVLQPVRRPRRARLPSEADIEAALAAAGSWKGLVDAEDLKEQLDEARGSDSPAPAL